MAQANAIPVGEVHSLGGSARAEGQAGVRELSQGSPVYQGDTLTTGPKGHLEVRFADETTLSQGPGASMTVDDYVLDNSGGGGRFLFDLAEGSFRMVTGEIADRNPDGVQIKSPLASIGIRGTTTVHKVDPQTGAETHGAEDLTGGRSLVMQDQFGNVQVITFDAGAVDVSPGQPMSAVRTLSMDELQTFKAAAPLTVKGEDAPAEDGAEEGEEAEETDDVSEEEGEEEAEDSAEGEEADGEADAEAAAEGEGEDGAEEAVADASQETAGETPGETAGEGEDMSVEDEALAQVEEVLGEELAQDAFGDLEDLEALAGEDAMGQALDDDVELAALDEGASGGLSGGLDDGLAMGDDMPGLSEGVFSADTFSLGAGDLIAAAAEANDANAATVSTSLAANDTSVLGMAQSLLNDDDDDDAYADDDYDVVEQEDDDAGDSGASASTTTDEEDPAYEEALEDLLDDGAVDPDAGFEVVFDEETGEPQVVDDGAVSDTGSGPGSGSGSGAGGGAAVTGPKLLVGGAGDDHLAGDVYDDTLIGGLGANTLDGGDGEDWVVYDYNESFLMGAGVTQLNIVLPNSPGWADTDPAGALFHDSLVSIEHAEGSVLADSMVGNDAANKLLGDDGDDTLSGGLGSDSLVGGEGSDSLYGGADSDYARVGWEDDETWGFSLQWDTADRYLALDMADPGNPGAVSVDTLEAVENVQMSAYGDTVDLSGSTGALAVDLSAGDDTMLGGAGADSVMGGLGADTVEGGAGNDAILGEAGVDSLMGGFGNDVLGGGAGDDHLDGDDGDDELMGGLGDDFLDGDAGTDTIDYTDHGYGIQYDAVAGQVLDLADPGSPGAEETDTVVNIEAVAGTDWGDSLYAEGYGLGLFMAGNAGADTLYGGDAADTLDGGADADTLYGGGAADCLTGGDGDDFADGMLGDDTILGGIGNDTLDGGSGDDSIWGDSGDDSIWGLDGADTLHGGAGDDLILDNNDVGVDAHADVISGGAGADTVFAGDQDQVFGEDGHDEVYFYGGGSLAVFGVEEVHGSSGDETLAIGDGAWTEVHLEAGDDSVHGGTGNNYLSGGAGADTLDGGDGVNVLVGGAGADWLYTGAGQGDVVYLDDPTHGGAGELLKEFDTHDKLRLDLDAFGMTLGNYEYVTGGAFDGTTGVNGSGAAPVFYLDTVTNWLHYDGDGQAAGTGLVLFTDYSGNIADTSFEFLDAGGVVHGTAGNDRFTGHGGADSVMGGDGADTFEGFDCGDSLGGQAGDDEFYMGLGEATVVGGETGEVDMGDVYSLAALGSGHSALVVVTGGATVATVSDGNESYLQHVYEVEGFEGTGGNDVFVLDDDGQTTYAAGGAGEDSLVTADALDVASFHGAGAALSVDLSFGTAVVADGQGGTDTLVGFHNLEGGKHADTLVGDAQGNWLDGDLNVDGQAELLEGGAGADTLVTGASTYAELEGGLGDDSLYSHGGSQDQLDGGAGADSVYGGDGDDWLEGGLGADTLDGGAGGDIFYWELPDEGGDTVLNYVVVDDTLKFEDDGFGLSAGALSASQFEKVSGTYSGMTGSVGAGFVLDTLNNVLWFDEDRYTADPDGEHHIAAFQGTTGGMCELDFYIIDDRVAGATVVDGTSGDDSLVQGTSGVDDMDLLAGHDLGYGMVDADLVTGDSGDDTLYGDGGGDTDVFESGDGADSLEGGAGDDLLFGEGASDTILGGDGMDTAIGGAGGDYLYGDGGEGGDVYGFETGDGDDELHGGLDEDYLFGEGGNDTLWGEAGADGLYGGDGDDLLEGGAGTDNLIGGSGADHLVAGDGADWVSGEAGADTLDLADTDNAVDTVAFDGPEAGVHDSLCNFGPEDQLVIDGAGFGVSPGTNFSSGDGNFAALTGGVYDGASGNPAASGQASFIYLEITPGGEHQLIFDDNGSDAGGDHVIAAFAEDVFLDGAEISVM